VQEASEPAASSPSFEEPALLDFPLLDFCPVDLRLKKLLIRLALAGTILAACWYGDQLWGGVPPTELWPELRRGLFAIVFLLAWRFRRGRIAWAAVLFATAAEALALGVPPPTVAALAIVLPLNLALLAWWKEFWVGTRTGLAGFSFLAFEALGVGLLGRPELAPWAERLSAPLFELEPAIAGALPFPQPGIAAFLLALVAIGLRLARRPGPLEMVMPGLWAAALLALSAPDSGPLYLAAGGSILVLALVEGAFALAFEDGLTGLPARRALEENLRHLGSRYAIAMADIDHFKRFNDRHGHEVGDQVLRMVARTLAGVGGGGRAFRYGGEEFALLFPGSTAREAQPHLEALRQEIAEQRFTVRAPDRPKRSAKKSRGKGGKGPQVKVTVSLGVAEVSEKRPTPAEVMKAADRALYRSKRAGRNRLTIGK